jgi:hypothetical protein
MTGRHRVPQAPACPFCGDPQEPDYALLCGPIPQKLLTGYSCPKAACVRAAEFARREREDELIADAIRRGVINP